MFTVVKVRDGQPPGDYDDPGWYRHPPGTQAYEWTGDAARGRPRPRPPASGRVRQGTHRQRSEREVRIMGIEYKKLLLGATSPSPPEPRWRTATSPRRIRDESR